MTKSTVETKKSETNPKNAANYKKAVDLCPAENRNFDVKMRLTRLEKLD